MHAPPNPREAAPQHALQRKLGGPAGLALAASVVLLITPSLFSVIGPGLATAYLMGLIGLALAAKALFRANRWDPWVLAGAGGVTLIMPWLAGFAAAPASAGLWPHLILGALLGGAGIWMRSVDRSMEDGGPAGPSSDRMRTA